MPFDVCVISCLEDLRRHVFVLDSVVGEDRRVGRSSLHIHRLVPVVVEGCDFIVAFEQCLESVVRKAFYIFDEPVRTIDEHRGVPWFEEVVVGAHLLGRRDDDLHVDSVGRSGAEGKGDRYGIKRMKSRVGSAIF